MNNGTYYYNVVIDGSGVISLFVGKAQFDIAEKRYKENIFNRVQHRQSDILF